MKTEMTDELASAIVGMEELPEGYVEDNWQELEEEVIDTDDHGESTYRQIWHEVTSDRYYAITYNINPTWGLIEEQTEWLEVVPKQVMKTIYVVKGK